jgi:hypothetical protein
LRQFGDVLIHAEGNVTKLDQDRPTRRVIQTRGPDHDEPTHVSPSRLQTGAVVTKKVHWTPRRLGTPELLVAIAVAFGLWLQRAERLIVSYPNDSQTHLQMVEFAERMLSHGQLPFDHWYAPLSLGSPFFVQYQSASAVLTGALGLAVGPRVAFAWTLYLLVALWPLCVYWTGRLFGLGRWESGIAAAISPLLYSITGRGFEQQAFAWLGSGLWSELWAMWTLPLALGFSWRFLNERRGFLGAVFFVAATIAFHFLMAYLAALLLIVMVFARRSELEQRIARGAAIGGAALLATLWVTIPLLADAKWTALNEFQVHTTIDDSYGAGTILRWLVTGKIYDDGRFPIVTILVAVGLIACVTRFRRDERARMLVGIWTASLLLYFGRPTLGFLLDRLPGNRDLLFQRFIAGVQLSGLFLAGIGAMWLFELARSAARRRGFVRPAGRGRSRVPAVVAAGLALAAVIVALAPAWSQLDTYDTNNAAWIAYQQTADLNQGTNVTALLDVVKQRGGGRVYAGMPSNWGHQFMVGGVQVYMYLENSGVDAVGFTLRTFSLMTDPEAWFDQDNPGDYGVFGIRYLLLPADMPPPVPAHLLTESGPYALWTVSSPGIVQVVDTSGSISADASDLGKQTKAFLASAEPGQDVYPTIAFNGQPPAAPTLAPGQRAAGPAGRVLSIDDDLANGQASATVVANRTSVVVLKASFDPGWSVTVDGVQVKPEVVAPALVGVTVAPGLHRVVFTYHGYQSYPLLFVVAVLALLAAAAAGAFWKRRASRVAQGTHDKFGRLPSSAHSSRERGDCDAPRPQAPARDLR